MAGSTSRSILIAGGGVGGLCAALAARAAGWDVEVHERVLDAQREAGTAFNLWGNAVTALSRVGLGDAVRDTGDPIEQVRLLDHRGRFLAQTPIGEISRGLGTESVSIRRADLIYLLHTACKDADIPVHLGNACRTFRTDGREVTLVLEDGTEARGAGLVGADGVRSAVRSALLADGEPIASSLPIRGISEVTAGAPPNTVLMAWGPNGGGVGCWPLGDGQVSWTVGTTSKLRRGLDSGQDTKTVVLDFIAGFPEMFGDLVRATPADRIAATSVLVRPTADIWGAGAVTLLGDAAHAMPTVFSQGACQALEDAAVLGEELTGTGDPVAAMRAYEARRKPRMDWLRKRVFMLDKLQKFENRLLCVVRDTMTRKTPPEKSVQSWERMLTFGYAPEEAK